ncbi:hypothetical protein KCQ_05561 [Pectobacterium atrosepticum ICMP 1526]|uniref:hypothetical protein n=1 Tax=Pectobacterium atrosepticum TaxID=29471 RepID=UPI00050382D8|nr:hypothetical protein [Pectobacterium atrosepticum]KFX10716.1 hypothetical protein JV34_22600 [Pectobacterium atrosepticum]KMK87251.1 hypothetical protein KCQ_05561 [Pectobacterium atrosepticum ICMP 1526]
MSIFINKATKAGVNAKLIAVGAATFGDSTDIELTDQMVSKALSDPFGAYQEWLPVYIEKMRSWQPICYH